MQYLDLDVNVESYTYEELKIPYQSSKTKIRNYIPDFLVKLQNGQLLLVEVKRSDKLNQRTVKKKIACAEEWCKLNNAKYELWTDEKIALISKQLKLEQVQAK